jgi:hypothetical protein
MAKNQTSAESRFPIPGDIVMYGKSTDGKGDVSEIPAIVLEVQTPGNVDSRVSLKTFEISHDMECRRDVKFAENPTQGCWHWRPDR